MRPSPREPSKQLKANSLPTTKRRAASAFMVCADTGPAATSAAITIANRARILIPLPQQSAVNRLLTTRIRRDHAPAWATNVYPIFTTIRRVGAQDKGRHRGRQIGPAGRSLRGHRAGEALIARAMLAPTVSGGADKVLFCQRFCASSGPAGAR